MPRTKVARKPMQKRNKRSSTEEKLELKLRDFDEMGKLWNFDLRRASLNFFFSSWKLHDGSGWWLQREDVRNCRQHRSNEEQNFLANSQHANQGNSGAGQWLAVFLRISLCKLFIFRTFGHFPNSQCSPARIWTPLTCQTLVQLPRSVWSVRNFAQRISQTRSTATRTTVSRLHACN